jgi:hypothetical protein
MPVEEGMQGGVPMNGQGGQVSDPFAPASQSAVSIPQATPVVASQPVPSVESPVGAIFGVPEEQNAPAPEKPAEKPDNDAVRYQHFQSLADQRANEIKQRDAIIQQLSAQNQQMLGFVQAQQMQATQSVQEPQAPTPPVAPERPERPSGFNREDALSDPKSESARYYDEMDKWRSQMDKHNQDLIAFERSLLEAERQQLQQQTRSIAEQNEIARQNAEATQYVQQNYGLTQEEAQAFIQMYSKPESVSMSNLVNLFKMSRGGAPVISGGQPLNGGYQPSPSFQQAQHAQQAGPVLHNMPAQTPNAPQNVGQAFMRTIMSNQHDPVKIFGE